MPELPEEAHERLQTEYGLTSRDAGVLVALGDAEGGGEPVSGVKYFERVARGRNAKTAANWFVFVLGVASATGDSILGRSGSYTSYWAVWQRRI
jgi:Asp-tRNA(Asn)/Glu-tRNA(Gln) amidotransferase B subunit